MNAKSKILLTTLGCLIGLAVAEQTGGMNCYFSKRISGLDRNLVRKPPATGDLVSTVSVERPATRWLPFIKFGKTVQVNTSQDRAANGAVFEKVETIHTNLLVIGFCSTAKYDELANQPLDGNRKNHMGVGLVSRP